MNELKKKLKVAELLLFPSMFPLRFLLVAIPTDEASWCSDRVAGFALNEPSSVNVIAFFNLASTLHGVVPFLWLQAKEVIKFRWN